MNSFNNNGGPNEGQSAAEKAPEQEFTKENLDSAALRFREFTDEIGEHIIEREDSLAQMELALIAREHCAMIGHPGTAKTTLARMVLERIDGATVFNKQHYEEMKHSEVVGPLLPQTTNGKTQLERDFEKGIAPCRMAILDEGFDAAAVVLKGAYASVLLDREIVDGNQKRGIGLQTAVLTSNKTLEQLALAHGTTLDAILDRFSFLFWTTQMPLRPGTAEKIVAADMKRSVAKDKGGDASANLGLEKPRISLADLDMLDKALKFVKARMEQEGVYAKLIADFYERFQQKLTQREDELGEGMKRSRHTSQRTMAKIHKILPAIAVRRYIRNPGTPLAVTPEDFKDLCLFMMMRGPVVSDIPADTDTLGNKQDAVILNRLKLEDDVFNETFREVVEPFAASLARNLPVDLNANKTKAGQLEQFAKDPVRGTQADDIAHVTNAIREMNGLILAIETTRNQIPEGEELFVKCVASLIRLWTAYLKIAKDRTTTVETYNSDVAPLVNKVGDSLFKKEIEDARALFQQALREWHETNAASPRAVQTVIGHLHRVLADADVLGHETVAALCGSIKAVCIAAIETGNLPRLADLVQDLEHLIDFFKRLKSDKEPYSLEKGAAVYTDVLKRTSDSLKTLVQDLQANITDATKREEILTAANAILALFEEQIANLTPGAEHRSQILEGSLDEYMDQATPSKQFSTQNPVGDLGYDFIEEGPDEQIRIQWNIIGEKDETFDADKLQIDYMKFVMAKLLKDETVLAHIPAVAALMREAKDEFKQYLCGQWRDEYEGLIEREVLRTVKRIIKGGNEDTLRCPVNVFGLSHNGLSIDMTEILTGFYAAQTASFEQNDQILGDFIGTQGILPDDQNLAAIRNLFNTNATGQITVKFVTQEILIDEAPILAFTNRVLAGRHGAEWDALRAAIQTDRDTIGKLISDQLAHERKNAASPQPAGSALPLANLRAKYAQLASSNTDVAGLQSRFPKIGIDVAADADLTNAVKQDAALTMRNLQATEELNFHDNFMVPFEELSNLARENGIAAEEMATNIASAILPKIEDWLAARANLLTQRKEKIIQIAQTGSCTAEDNKIVIAAAAGKPLKQKMFDSEDLKSVQDFLIKIGAQADAGNPHPALAAYIQTAVEILQSSIETALSIFEKLELPDHGFSMINLSALTKEKARIVEEALKQEKIGQKITGVIDILEQMNIPQAAPQIDAYRDRVKAVTSAFRKRCDEVDPPEI